MRFRHFGAFPFSFHDGATNPAACEPLVLTLAEAARLWWKVRRLAVSFSITATYDGDTRTFNNATLVDPDPFKPRRYFDNQGGITGFMSDGDELALCYPGADNGSGGEACKFSFSTSQTQASWGSGLINDFAVSCVPFFFARGNSQDFGLTDESNQIVSRGTWAGASVSPSCAIEFRATFGNGVNSASLLASNLTLLTPTGTFAASVFGHAVTLNYRTDESVFAGFTVDAIGLTITEDAAFAYDP